MSTPRLVGIIQERGGRACLATSGEALRLGCQARPYLVKPNRAEAETLCGFAIRSQEECPPRGAGLPGTGRERGGPCRWARMACCLAAENSAVWAIPPKGDHPGPNRRRGCSIGGPAVGFPSPAWRLRRLARWGGGLRHGSRLLPRHGSR